MFIKFEDITVDNLQLVFDDVDEIYRRNEWSMDRCVEYLDELQQKIDDGVTKYMNYHMKERMRPRTLGEFYRFISTKTDRQEDDVSWWVPLYARIHFKGTSFNVIDRGVGGKGNRGRLIVESKNFSDPDYLLISDVDEYPFELKCSPVDWKATYKITELESIRDHKSTALTIHLDDYGPKKFYTIMSTEIAIKMLAELPRSYRFPGFRGKECVALTEDGGPIEGGISGRFSDYMKKFSIVHP